MKKIFVFSVLLFTFHLQAKEERKPSQVELFAQVQLCAGTEDLGNEGQGMGASAMINLFNDPNVPNSDVKCELGLAFSYEYGNVKGLKIGGIAPFNVAPVSVGKTECTVTKEGDSMYISVRKLVKPNSKSKKPPKVFVDRCLVNSNGT